MDRQNRKHQYAGSGLQIAFIYLLDHYDTNTFANGMKKKGTG
jgi:hypothetical protein